MSEQFLDDLNRQRPPDSRRPERRDGSLAVLRPAPRPHRHRLWYFWPVLAFAGITLATALYALYFEDARATAAALFVVSGGLTASVTWLEGNR